MSGKCKAVELKAPVGCVRCGNCWENEPIEVDCDISEFDSDCENDCDYDSDSDE